MNHVYFRMVKEIRNITKTYNLLKNNPEKLAMATVVKVEGSSYRRTGARMLIQENGVYTGGISGGCIEGDALKKAFLSIANNVARLVTYDTSIDSEEQIGVSLGCNGIIHVLISPVDKSDVNNPVEQLIRCTEQRKPNVLITVISSKGEDYLSPGEVMRYGNQSEPEEDNASSLPIEAIADIKEVLVNQKSLLKDYGANTLFIEYLPPEVRIVIMGGNYDVYPLLKASDNLGWDSVVVANKNRLNKHITELAKHVYSSLEEVEVDDFTVGVIMSHDYNADFNNLAKAVDSKLAYIGLLGPAKRKVDMLKELRNNQANLGQKTIFGPAGLDIGASQPEEIAISIVAEIIAVMRARPGRSLKDREGSIYSR